MVDKAICMCSIETSGEKMHKFDTTVALNHKRVIVKLDGQLGRGVAAQTI